MDEQSHLNSASGSSDKNISLLKDRLEEGIKILSDKLTIKSKPGHPLYLSYRDRGLRYGILNNKHIKRSTINQFHPRAYTLKQLEKIFNEINRWADKCNSDIEVTYNDKYSDRFSIFRLPTSVLKVSLDEDSLAILQNRLKTQLENLINFIVHRIAFFEEFGQYDKIMQIELLIDRYTRILFELLYNIGDHNNSKLYSSYLDPLSFFIISKINEQLLINPEADIDFIIDKLKSVLGALSREDFCFASGVPIGMQDAENINSKIRVTKDSFEREHFELNVGKLPEKFKFIWDKDIEDFHGYQKIIDLMEALNRLPVNLRDLENQKDLVNSFSRKINGKDSQQDKYEMVPFPTPIDAKWSDVHISIYNNEFVNIRVGEIIKKNIHYRQIGFPAGIVKKNKVEPGQLWLLLIRFGRSPNNSLPDRSMCMGMTYSQSKAPTRRNAAMDNTKSDWYYDKEGEQQDGENQDEGVKIDMYAPDISTVKMGAECQLPKTLKVAISRMRKILSKYFGISGDPFFKYDKEGKCYKTKFRVSISSDNHPDF